MSGSVVEAMGVLDWIKAFFSHWQVWASGGGLGGAVLLIINLVQAATGWKMSAKWQLLILLVFFVIGASYMLWRDDQKGKIRLQSVISGLQRSLDDLTLSAITGEIRYAIRGQQGSGSHVAVIVEIKNSGASTGIVPSSWHLSVTTVDGKKYEGWANSLKDKNLDFCLGTTRLFRFVKADALYLKTESSIGRNESKQGMLWFTFPTLPVTELENPPTALLLEADTVSGQHVSIATTVKRLIELSSKPTIFFGGITNPSPLDLPCKENQPY